jgi:hypothetical protein
MVFGQVLAERPFSTALAIVGLGIWIILVTVSVGLEGRNRP